MALMLPSTSHVAVTLPRRTSCRLSFRLYRSCPIIPQISPNMPKHALHLRSTDIPTRLGLLQQ